MSTCILQFKMAFITCFNSLLYDEIIPGALHLKVVGETGGVTPPTNSCTKTGVWKKVLRLDAFQVILRMEFPYSRFGKAKLSGWRGTCTTGMSDNLHCFILSIPFTFNHFPLFGMDVRSQITPLHRHGNLEHEMQQKVAGLSQTFAPFLKARPN